MPTIAPAPLPATGPVPGAAPLPATGPTPGAAPISQPQEQSGPQFNQQQSQQLSPTLVALTRAIRNTETGGQQDPFSAKGGSGEWGAYQFTKGTWDANAPKYGVNSAFGEATPSEQNKVAYNMIKAYADQGYKADQIASLWNSGKPDYEGNVGVNKYGVKYDTPQYVQSVMKTFQSYKQGNFKAPITPTSSTVGNEQVLNPTQATDYNAHLQAGTPFAADTNNPSVVGEAAKTIGNFVPDIFNFAKGTLNTVLHPIQTAKTIFGSPIGGLGIPGQGPTNSIYESLVPQFAKDVLQGGTALAFGNPNAAGDSFQSAQRDVVNQPFQSIAPLVMGAEGLAKGLDASGLTENAGETMNSAIEKGASPVTAPARTVFGAAKNVAQNLIGKETPAEQFQGAVGQAFQPKTPYEATAAQKVASNVDFSSLGKNPTYFDLESFLQSQANDKLAQLDQKYAANPATFKPETFDQTFTGAGGSTAKVNFVQEAINGLKELYTSSKDPANLVKIQDLEERFNSDGLTGKEINDLAKKYGSEFGQKAFSKLGEPRTTVSAQAFENVRSGVKDAARSTLPDEEAKALDKNVSSLLRAKDMASRMAKRVDQLSNKVTKRGLVEKIGRLGGTMADNLTLHGAKAFISKLLFPSNVGLKTMNSLDLEAALGKNLTLANNLVNAPDGLLIRTLKNLSNKTKVATRKSFPLAVAASVPSNNNRTNFGIQ